MIRATALALLVLATSGIVGCAGPIETVAGIDGAGLSGQSTLAVVPALGAGNAVDEATSAVIAVLTRRGMTVSETSAAKLTVAIAERPAALGILDDDGKVLSGSKGKRLLQSCADRTHRMLLVLEAAGAPPVRAWAEEDHCNGALSASVMPLAERAVAALADQRTGLTLRSGRD
jgi:hypothetical protein